MYGKYTKQNTAELHAGAKMFKSICKIQYIINLVSIHWTMKKNKKNKNGTRNWCALLSLGPFWPKMAILAQCQH